MTRAGSTDEIVADHPAPGVARLLLNRPGVRNAIDGPLVEALTGALANAGDAHAIVLGSAAPGMFCSGADRRLADEERARVSDALYVLYERMRQLPAPIVAAVTGDAVGGGAQLAAAADLRVIAPGARLRFPGPGHGLAVGAWALRSLVGRGRAADLCLSMRWVGAAEALAIGLADRVSDDPAATAVELAASVAALDPHAVARTKRILAGDDLAALHAEREGNARWTGSLEGLSA